jgi:tetratricopeptide (TPR) repeat protein
MAGRCFAVAICALVLAAAKVRAQVPATLPAGAKPIALLSLADFEDAHRQAVALMRAGKYQQAGEIFEKLYKISSPPTWTRAFVLNHAILDLSQKKLAMRAVRDLGTYLRSHPERDELATDLLGACLNAAVASAGDRIKHNPLWLNGQTEWERRNSELDHSRPGFRRWGSKWIAEKEYQAIEAKRNEISAAIKEQTEAIARWAKEGELLVLQQQEAMNAKETWRNARLFLEQAQRDPGPSVWSPTLPFPVPQPVQVQSNSNNPPKLTAKNQIVSSDALATREIDSWLDAQVLGGQITGIIRQINAGQTKIRELQKRYEAIHPTWTEPKLDPVDPDAPDPAVAKAAAAAIPPPNNFPGVTEPATPSTAPSALPAPPAVAATQPSATPASSSSTPPRNLYGEPVFVFPKPAQP